MTDRQPLAPLCSCDERRTVMALLQGDEPPLCPHHDADKLSWKESERARTEAEEHADLVTRVYEQMNAEQDAESRAAAHARFEAEEHAARAALHVVDPLLGAVVDAAGGSSTQALNSPGLVNGLARQLGATVNGELPPAA